jgi:hypothetical protein
MVANIGEGVSLARICVLRVTDGVLASRVSTIIGAARRFSPDTDR